MNPPLQQRLRVMQIIVLAMIAGVASFLVIAVGLRASGQLADVPETPMITYVALFFMASATVAHLVVPRQIAASTCRRLASEKRLAPLQQERSPDEIRNQLVTVYQTTLLIAVAMLEGPAFFLLVAYLIEGQTASLVAAGLLVAGMAARFPTRLRVENWLEQQQMNLEQ